MVKPRILTYIPVILLTISMLSSCKKEAGEGGTSTIQGKVTVYNFDNNGFQCCPDTFSARDERVYIIYGADGSFYDDDVRTSYDGTYEFRFLQKGKYRIYAYTEDSTGAHNGTAGTLYRPDLPVFSDVEITSNNQTIVAPEIIILKTQN